MEWKMSENEYHHGELRKALIETGRKLMEKTGIEKLSIRSLAMEIGVSHNAPYRHFKNKNELLAAIANEGYHELYLAMKSSASEDTDDISEQIRSAAFKYIKLTVDNPEMTRLMFGGVLIIKSYPELSITASNAYEALKDIVRNGIQNGQLKRIDTETGASALWSVVHGISMILQAEQYPSAEMKDEVIRDTTQSVINVILNGMLS